jgi:ketosteroid isomerase-like protein
MSRENVEIVRRSFDAWNEWDVEAIRSLYANDVVVETGITEFGRTFEGDDPIRRWVVEYGRHGASCTGITNAFSKAKPMTWW